MPDDSTPPPAPRDSGAGNSGNGTLYAAADCERVDLQNGGMLLIHRRNRSQMIVSPEVAAALQGCRTYRTLEAHAEYLAATVPQLAGQQANVLQVLKTVRDQGLMTPATATCERLCPPDTPPAVDLPPTRAFVITCDRPTAVQRLLESMLHAGNLTHHEHLFLVDDSRDADNAARNREAVARFNLVSPTNMHYVGMVAQQRLMTALSAELPEHEQGLRFLIDRERWSDKPSYGLARNLCLLLSMGRRAIVMDDDVICAAVESPHKGPGLTFGDRQREVDFYTSQEQILQRTARADFDPLTGHARCLGITLAQAIRKLGCERLEENQLREASGHCLDLWSADSPVLVTQCGTLGDPGTPGTRWLYTLDPASTRRLLAWPGGLEAARASRNYWMGQPRPMFGKLAVMSQVTGLDNSRLLPPYFPVFRNEDDLFGAMLELLHPHAVVLDYDWAIPHFPLESRETPSEQDPPTGNVTLRLGKYLADHTQYRRGACAETRLAHLFALVKALSETSDEGLITLYRAEMAHAQAVEARRLTSRLQDGITRPEAWQAYLGQRLAKLNEAMQTVPRVTDHPGVAQGGDEATVLAKFRDYAAGFAGALQGWAAIRSAAERVARTMLDRGDFTPQ